MPSHLSESNDNFFARDRAFWNNYLKGRPQAPPSFFDRIYRHHQEHRGKFGTAHDVGAGNGPYSLELRSRFQHVIVSDVVPGNVQLAEDRLGTDGFSYRTAKVEEVDDIPTGSVDLVFATNVMHFVDQKAGMEAIAKQLKSGGTFAAAGFGPALFNDTKVQDVWSRMMQQGGRVILKMAEVKEQSDQTIRVMERSKDGYNVAPLDERLFLPGAKRIHLNMEKGGITGLMPPERRGEVSEPIHTGPSEVETFESDEGWGFEFDLNNFKEHFASFPLSDGDPDAFVELWQEVEDLIRDGSRLDGVFPAHLILATRR